MATVLNTPPTKDNGAMKNTLSMVSCSKLFAHNAIMMPSRPNTIETLMIQNRNSKMLYMCVAPKSMPIARMPSDVTTERTMVMASEPMIIST